MKVAILGIDGYLGWNLACYLANRDYEVCGLDNFIRERLVREEGAESYTPISPIELRLKAVKEIFGVDMPFEEGDVTNYQFVKTFLTKHKPDAIVFLSEIPSAPFSMKSPESAILTMQNNIIGTLNLLWAMHKVAPNTHLIKLGTLGEMGVPNIDIPDGDKFDVEYHGRKDVLPFPKQPPSFYHCTKVADTVNIAFACKVWGIKSTDLQQGPVYSAYIPETREDYRLVSRLDYGGEFGTVINRYCIQALCGYPLSPYGRTALQTRGFIWLEDTMRCIELSIENPPLDDAPYRSFNQFFELFNVTELAEKVKAVCEKKGIDVEIKNIENPRVEKEKHYYNPSNEGLLKLGVKPHKLDDMLPVFIDDLMPFKDRVIKEAIAPKVKWR